MPLGNPPHMLLSAECSYCAGKVMYAFSGKRVVLLVVPAGVFAWLVYPYVGAVSFSIFLAASLLPAVYLEKRF